MRVIIPIALLALAVSAPALADPADAIPGPLGLGSKGYVWNRMTTERAEVMRLSGDAARGKEAFRVCRGCHKSDGFGRVDGTYPRLTGQHAAVVIKQVTDIRAGIRINPKMEPFSSDHNVTPQEIADIAAFLAAEVTVRENGKGPGDEVRRGERLYRNSECATCHGERGEGNGDKLYPAVAAQHYSYLLRELEHIRAGSRGNSHPDMVKALRAFSPGDLEAVADYMSRLPDHRTEPARRSGN